MTSYDIYIAYFFILFYKGIDYFYAKSLDIRYESYKRVKIKNDWVKSQKLTNGSLTYLYNSAVHGLDIGYR